REAVVGEKTDETYEDVRCLEAMPEGTTQFAGVVSIAELNDVFGLQLPDEDYTTVGGFVLGRLGRLPRVGDEVEIRGGRLRVLSVKGRRIERLALHLAPRIETGTETEEDTADDFEHESLE